MPGVLTITRAALSGHRATKGTPMNQYTDYRDQAYAATDAMTSAEQNALLDSLIYSLMGDAPADTDQLRQIVRYACEIGPAHEYGEYCECPECVGDDDD